MLIILIKTEKKSDLIKVKIRVFHVLINLSSFSIRFLVIFLLSNKLQNFGRLMFIPVCNPCKIFRIFKACLLFQTNSFLNRQFSGFRFGFWFFIIFLFVNNLWNFCWVTSMILYTCVKFSKFSKQIYYFNKFFFEWTVFRKSDSIFDFYLFFCFPINYKTLVDWCSYQYAIHVNFSEFSKHV